MYFNLPRDYLSASQISMYLRCGMQYWFRYIEGISRPPGIAALQGTALHETNEQYYNDVIKNKAPFTPRQAAEFAMFSFEQEVDEKGYAVNDKTKDETAVILTHTTESYISNVATIVRPISTEEEVRYQANCGVTVLGYLDLRRRPFPWELQLNPNLDQVIADYKLTGKKWNLDKLTNSLQFMLYTIATGVGRVEIHNITRATKKPKKNKVTADQQKESVVDPTSNIRMIRHDFNGDEYNHVENLITRVAEGISKGVFMPCDPDSWACSETWCGYWDRCRGKKLKAA